MNLEEARKIKDIVDTINDIDEKIKEISECSFLQIEIIKGIEPPSTLKAYKDHAMCKSIIQSLKTERDALIRELNDIGKESLFYEDGNCKRN